MVLGYEDIVQANLVLPETTLLAGPDGIWLLRIPDPRDFPPSALSVLDPGEHRRLKAFHRESDRVAYGYSHVALRVVLGMHLGVDPGSVRFGRAACPCCGGPHGRPVLAGTPTPCEFSLSHGGSHVMIGVARTLIGVDVEPFPGAQAARELTRMLHPAEQHAIKRHTAGEDAEDGERGTAAFTRLWARKEAYLKALGTGLGRSLAEDDLTAAPPGWQIADIPLGTHHAAAYAVDRRSG